MRDASKFISNLFNQLATTLQTRKLIQALHNPKGIKESDGPIPIK